jgi:hypothetical protein
MEFVPPVMMMPGPDSIYTPVQKSGATSLHICAHCANRVDHLSIRDFSAAGAAGEAASGAT